MRLIVRFSWLLILLGLAAGLVLRVALGGRRLRLLLAVALAPVTVHALWVVSVAARRASGGGGALALFALGAAVVTLAAWWAGRRLEATRPVLASLVPAGHALLYALLPLALFARDLDGRGVRLDAIPAAMLGGVTLFAVVALWVYALRAPQLPGPGRWLRRR